MRAIELNSQTDKEGNLKIDFQLEKSNRKVRILILFEDESNAEDEELLWMQSISSNPAFAFLASEEENIYSLNDREPLPSQNNIHPKSVIKRKLGSLNPDLASKVKSKRKQVFEC
jgi:hypothetical protein